MRRDDLVMAIAEVVAEYNRINKHDLLNGIGRQHLMNKFAARMSAGNAGRHPKFMERLIENSRDVEDFVQSLKQLAVEFPTADEAMEILKRKPLNTDNIYCEETDNE